MATGGLAHKYCEAAYGCTRTPAGEGCTEDLDCFGKTACDYFGDMTWGLRDGQLGPILELLKGLLGLRLHPNGTMHRSIPRNGGPVNLHGSCAMSGAALGAEGDCCGLAGGHSSGRAWWDQCWGTAKLLIGGDSGLHGGCRCRAGVYHSVGPIKR